MKVLVCHNLYRSAAPSGENVVVANEISQLRAAGIDVQPLIADSDDIAAMPVRQKVGVALGPVYNRTGVSRVRDAIRRGVDVLHVHNVYTLLSPAIIQVAARANVPVVQTVHNFRHDCVAGTYYRDGAECHDCTGRRLASPAVRHACYRGSTLQTGCMVVGRRVHARTWRELDHYLALTQQHVDYLTALGVDRHRISLRRSAVSDPGPPAAPGRDVLYVGRLDEAKGILLLLDAWHARPSAAGRRLVVLGGGPLESLVAEAAAEDPSIVYAGSRTAGEVARAMRAAGVVAIPSLCLEGLPRVFLEALSHGRAVMTTTSATFASSVADVGWVRAPTVDAWSSCLASLDDTAIKLRGVAARAMYEDRHTVAASVQQLTDLYERLRAQAETTRGRSV